MIRIQKKELGGQSLVFEGNCLFDGIVNFEKLKIIGEVFKVSRSRGIIIGFWFYREVEVAEESRGYVLGSIFKCLIFENEGE